MFGTGKMMNGIVVMGGSFNPPTRAHVQLMEAAMEAVGTCRGIFVPTAHEYVAEKMKRQKCPQDTLNESIRLAMEEKAPFTEYSPGKSKGVGRRVQLRPDWEAVKVGIMEDIVRVKFTQHPELAAKLQATGDMILVEGNHWGIPAGALICAPGRVKTTLGKFL